MSNMVKSVKSEKGLTAPEWLKINEACQILDVSRNTLKALVREGILPAYKIEGVVGYKFKRAEVESLIKRVEPEPAQKGKRATKRSAARSGR